VSIFFRLLTMYYVGQYAAPQFPYYTPTPTYGASWSSYGTMPRTPPPSVTRADSGSMSAYEGTTPRTMSSGSGSIGYSSETSSVPSSPLRGSASSAGVSPMGNTSIPYGVGNTSIPHPGAAIVATLPGGLPASGPDYVAELGRAAWKVFHAVAEQYPAVPTYEDQQSAMQYIFGFAKLYPCLKCRQHFQQLLAQYPPDVSSQPAFRHWVIAIHNRVNADLGKPQWAP
jgi:hypothetical protein